MIPKQISYFPISYNKHIIITFFIVLGLCTLIFNKAILPWLWVVFATIEVLAFFILLNLLSLRWQKISTRAFVLKIFLYSLVIRITWVIFSYYFFIAQTGEPFDWVMADSFGYHNWAVLASDQFAVHGFDQFFNSVGGYADLGYPIYLTIVYLIFGNSILFARLIFALISAISSVLVYRIAKRNFGESAGRLAAIIAMLIPNFIYYTGLHLKEPLMVLIILAFMERADYLLQSKKVTIVNILFVISLGATLFFFRTVLGISAVFALFSALILGKRLPLSWLNRMIISFWFLIITILLVSDRLENEINYYVEAQDYQGVNMQWRANIEEGNKFAIYGSTFVFFPIVIIAPFPTFVHIEVQKQQMLLSGAYFIKNVMAFFVILSIVLLIKRKLIRKYIFLLSFILFYFFALARSSFAISERFHMPILPFIIILGAWGITQINKQNKKLFIPYLVFLALIIIGWNWFKLAGRGMV